MNIVEVVQDILTNCPLINEFTNEVHTDFVSQDTDKDYGLSPTGDSLISKDIIGNQTRTCNMVLYATNQSLSDYERLQNSTFLIDLGLYLESKKGLVVTATIDDKVLTGVVKSITCANGMAWAKSEDGQCITYQLQINVTYNLESEEI